jgi:hypothetical protein
MARPSSEKTSTAMLSLPWVTRTPDDSGTGMTKRIGSPSNGSILITVAPWSASMALPKGPA